MYLILFNRRIPKALASIFPFYCYYKTCVDSCFIISNIKLCSYMSNNCAFTFPFKQIGLYPKINVLRKSLNDVVCFG